MDDFWLIGVTGGSGSGKSTACRFLASLGYAVIDADKIGHEIDASDEFRAAFGNGCINPETDRVHRPYLRDLIVKDKTILKKTEEIMKPLVVAKIERMISVYRLEGRIIAFVDAPLLFESGFDSRCRFKVCVLAPRSLRIDRVVKRDNQTIENTEGLFALQLPDEDKILKSDWIINNDAQIVGLYAQVVDLLRELHFKIIKDMLGRNPK